MALHYDLHIHSCLSPCAQEDMTPANICAMARLKGLDVIAVTDHQSAGNLPAVAACAAREGLLLVPGLEVCTREEVHVLCYFADVAAAQRMGMWCYGLLPDIPNRPDYFGEQSLVNERDEVIGTEPRMLLMGLTAGLDEVIAQARALGGVPVPAHINRGENGILTALGFLPPEARFTALEISPELPLPDGLDISRYRVLHSSDAHQLGDIAERGHTIPAAPGAAEVLRWLGHATA